MSRASLSDGTIVCDGYRVERSVRLDVGDETYRVTGPKGQAGLLHVLFLRVRDRSLARWKHEITGVNRVGHPAIPKTLAGGATESGRAAIVTEAVSGESLEELRRAWGGQLPGEAATTFVCEVLEALEAAHSRGVVHGALRPRSVYVDAERIGSRICIADFGYSRLFEESHRRGRALSEAALASAAFLAPEQRTEGYAADARTDIFAAGMLALYLLGEDPLTLTACEKAESIPLAARKEAVEARVRQANLPSKIAAALFQAIHPSRPERQAAARVLLDELRGGVAESADGGARPSEPATHDDPPTIATIAELQRVLIEEARLSMGATDTGVDPLAVPRVETPFQGESADGGGSAAPAPASSAPAAAPTSASPRVVHAEDASPPSVAAESAAARPMPSDTPAPVHVPSSLFGPYTENSRSVMMTAPEMDRLRAMPSPIGGDTPPPKPLRHDTPPPQQTTEKPAKESIPVVSVGAGRSERPEASAPVNRDHVGGLLAGRYVLDRPLASGGMATVYLGCLLGEGGMARTVAIKRVHPSLAVDARCTAMMLDEARMASRISHPNVVPILDVIREADEIMLVLEYVHGVTASQLAREGKDQTAIPPAIATSIVVGALRGLDAAHAATDVGGRPMGLVHRDVSPQNIMVGRDGAARVIDFGIARALGRAEVTTGTELRGKVAYMAPERLRGQKTDLRVDLWSAGVVLWELVSGTKLFQAEDPIEVAVRVCTGSIPQTGHDALDAVLERALARDLEERFRTAGEMADALEAALPPATPAEVSEYMKQGCGRLLDAQSMALTSLKNRIEKGPLPEPMLARLRTPMGFAVSPISTRASSAVEPVVNTAIPLDPRATNGSSATEEAPRASSSAIKAPSLELVLDTDEGEHELAPRSPPSARRAEATSPATQESKDAKDKAPQESRDSNNPSDQSDQSGAHALVRSAPISVATGSGATMAAIPSPASSSAMGSVFAVIAVLCVVAGVLALFLFLLSGTG